MKATGWAGRSAIQKLWGEPFSDGRHAVWRVETCLVASGHRDYSKGITLELLTSAQNNQLELGLGARHPGYSCWVSLWMEFLPSCAPVQSCNSSTKRNWSFQARKPLHLLFHPFQWWTDMSNEKRYTLVQLPCCFAGIWFDIPCSIWGIFSTSELAYQLHMYQTDLLTTKTLRILLEIMGISLSGPNWAERRMWKPCLDHYLLECAANSKLVNLTSS